MRSRVPALLLILLLSVCAAARAEDLFSLRVPEKLIPYADNVLTVSAPRDGKLTVRVGDGVSAERDIVTGLAVTAGETEIVYDALSFNDQPLDKRRYTLSAELDSAGGTLLYETGVYAGEPAEALVYAIASCDELYRTDHEWYIDCGASKACVLIGDIYAAADPDTRVCTVRASERDAGVRCRMNWNGKITASRYAPPGEYLIRVYAMNAPDRAAEIPFRVCEGRREKLPLPVNVPLFPEDLSSDAAVWAKLTEPVIVIDRGVNSGTKVYEKPDSNSACIGSVHGQSAAVKLLEEPEGRFARVGVFCYGEGVYREGYIAKDALKAVCPDTRYGIVIDKEKQEMHIWADGKKAGTVAISTGSGGKGAVETFTGVYLTADRVGDFNRDGYRYDYAVRIDGPNLIHQLGYTRDAGGRHDFSDQQPLLGQAVSHGCVRIDSRITEASGGINAYWCWTHLAPRTKVMVFDSLTADPEKP